MDQVIQQEESVPMVEALRKQQIRNQSYISQFTKLRNCLMQQTGQLLLDYEHINFTIEGLIAQLENGKRLPNNSYDDNLRRVVLEYQMSDGPGLQLMDNLQKDLGKMFNELHTKLFPYDNKVIVFNFERHTEISECPQFKEFQDSKYIQNKHKFGDFTKVDAAEISSDEKYLVSISGNKIIVWDYLKNIMLQRHTIDTRITTFTYLLQSNNIVFADDLGRVHQIFMMNDIIGNQDGFKVHEREIHFILVKSMIQIFTCSQDNTIKLIDLTRNIIMFTLNYKCPCQSNFVYSPIHNILIVPNGNYINLFENESKIQLTDPCEFDIESRFLSMLLSDDEGDLYLTLPYQQKINNYFVNCKAKELELARVFVLYAYFYNFSLCFDDRVLALLTTSGFEFRHLDDDNIELIKEIKAPGTQKFYFNKQHPKSNKLITLKDFSVVVYERVQRI